MVRNGTRALFAATLSTAALAGSPESAPSVEYRVQGGLTSDIAANSETGDEQKCFLNAIGGRPRLGLSSEFVGGREAVIEDKLRAQDSRCKNKSYRFRVGYGIVEAKGPVGWFGLSKRAVVRGTGKKAIEKVVAIRACSGTEETRSVAAEKTVYLLENGRRVDWISLRSKPVAQDCVD